MCLESVGKLEVGGGNVGVLAVEIAVAGGIDPGRHRVGQTQNHRNVVGRKAPENVFFGADFSEVQPVGVDVLESAELARVHQFAQFQIGRVILKQVTDHQDSLMLPRHLAQAPRVAIAQGEGFFDVDVLAGGQGVAGNFEVRDGRGRDHEGRNLGVFEHRPEIVDPDGALFFGDWPGNRHVGVANGPQAPEFAQHSCEILAPIAGAHQRNVLHDGLIVQGVACACPV